MDYLFVIVALVLVLLGLVGAVVPAVPGPPLCFIGLMMASFAKKVEHSTGFLVAMGLVAVLVLVFDYLVPIWGTKKLGGSQAGVRGSTIGLVLGLLITLFFPIGFIAVLIGPFVGAYIGEKRQGTPDHLAWRSALGSFVGFLTGTFVKLVYGVVCAVFVVKDLFVLFVR